MASRNQLIQLRLLWLLADERIDTYPRADLTFQLMTGPISSAILRWMPSQAWRSAFCGELSPEDSRRHAELHDRGNGATRSAARDGIQRRIADEMGPVINWKVGPSSALR